MAFKKCVTDFGDEFDWIALFDHDEFFVPIRDTSVREYLQSMDEHASICINWAMFGSSGYVDYPDKLMTQAFVNRAPLDFATNRHVKSIVRPKEVVDCWSHAMDMREGVPMVDSKGNAFEWHKHGKFYRPVGLEDTARFHHYMVRSRAHWEKRMAIPYMAQKRSKQSFETYDVNDVYDPIVEQKFGPILERIADTKKRLICEDV
jgi:hypothetical protein